MDRIIAGAVVGLLAVLPAAAREPSKAVEVSAQAVVDRCRAIYHLPDKAGKEHFCICRESINSKGHKCGKRSAHESDRLRGAKPICYAEEVTPELKQDFVKGQAGLMHLCKYRDGRY